MPYDTYEFENYVSTQLTSDNKDKFNYWSAAAGIGTVGALGFLPTSGNTNIWSSYIRGLQHFEGLSPFQVFRTFRLSEFFSPLGPPSSFQYSPSSYSHLLGSPAFQDYISKTTGLSLSRLEELGAFRKGFEFRKTGSSVYGELHVLGGGLMKKNVQMLSTGYGPGSGFTAEWFARIAGSRKPKDFLSPWVEELGEAARAPDFVPIAAPLGRRQLHAQYAHAIASAGVNRLNLLLQSPFQTDTFKNLAKKAPFLNRLVPRIKEGTALQMLGRYTLFAGKAVAAVHGLKYLDYLQREQNPLISLPRNVVVGGLIGAALTKSKKGAIVGAAALGISGAMPVFQEGFLGGALDIYAEARIDLAKLTTPWRAGAARAEANFEGITKLTTLAGFAGAGLLLGGAADHFDRLKIIAKTYKSEKAAGNKLYELAEDAIKARRENIANSFETLAAGLEGKQKLLVQSIGRWRQAPGYQKGIVAGAGVFGALSTVGSLISGDFLGAATTAAGFTGAGVAWAKGKPLLAGLSMLATFALRGDKSAEELQRIYSGEQLVDIRRGRWWESGRCLTISNTCRLFSGEKKNVQDVCIGDVLIGRDGLPADVLAIYSRKENGIVYSFSSGFDRDIKTELTGNHIVPIKHSPSSDIEEVEAKDIKVNDYVEIPLSYNLKTDLPELNVLDYITFPCLVDNRRVFCAQRNWFSGKYQKSGRASIPERLKLDRDTGLLFGYYLAEGNLSFKGDVPQFIETAHPIDELGQRIVKDIIRICEEKFDITPTIRKKMTGKKTKEGCFIVRICSSILAKLFLGLFYNKEKYIALEKRIPSEFFDTQEDFKEGLIDGYSMGDGHFDRFSLVISSSRKWLLSDIQLIAFSLGKPCGVGPKEENGTLGRWRLRFVNENSTNPAVIIENGRVFAAIRSIETREYDGTVYDFEVNSEEHLFQAGVFLVHNSPWEGKRPYYRKHRIALMKEHLRETALYGSEEFAWDTDPLVSPISFLMDPYAREKKMWEQGWRFPVTQTPFEDFPILGPVLAATIGQLIKPTKYIAQDQWMEPEGIGPAPPGYENLPAPTPTTKTSIGSTIGEQISRIQELSGLPGFITQSLTEKIIGQETLFTRPQLMSPQVVAGIEPAYWSLNLGGILSFSEPIRRFITKRRSEVDLVNPLPSGLPSWLPQGPNSDYFLDFSRADIYTKFEEPWARLPGEGFLKHRFPELAGKGLKPEDYPALVRLVALCLDPSTRVYTDGDVKEIKDIEPGDYVYGDDCSLKRVVAKSYKKDRRPRYSIKTFYNNDESLVCSGEHKILVADKDENIFELPASKITKEHYLLFPKRKKASFKKYLCIGDYCDVSDVNIKYENGEYWGHVKGSQNFIRFNLPASYSIGRIFGLYIAEGYSPENSGQIVYCFHEKEKETLGKEVKDFAEYLGLSWYERGFNDTKAYQVSFGNKLFGRFLRNLFGHGAANKKIGLDLTQFPYEFLLGLVDGYFDGDGNLAIMKTSITLRASSISKKLLEQVRFALCSLGITSAIRERKGNYKQGNKNWKRKAVNFNDAFVLDIKRGDIKRLPGYQNIDLSNHIYNVSTSKKFGFEGTDFVAFRVKEITISEGETEWVDISIDNPSGEGRFVTVSGIVHNSDLAPWSQEFKQYSSYMSQLADSGQLTPEQVMQVQEVKKQVAEVKRRKDFTPYKYDMEQVRRETVTITSQVEPGLYLTKEFGTAPISLAGINTSTAALARVAKTESPEISGAEAFRRAEKKRIQVNDYIQQKLRSGSQLDIYVSSDPSSLMKRTAGGPIVPAVAIGAAGENINRQLEQLGLAERLEQDDSVLANMAGASFAQQKFGAFWENLLHGMETPLEVLTPIAPTSKFINQKTPLEDYQRSRIYAREFAMWDQPISHFIAPGLKTVAWWAGWRGLPNEVKQRYMVEEYFDRLEYEKQKRVQSAAIAAGQGDVAAEAATNKVRTMTGADKFSYFQTYMALPKAERDYFKAFVEAPTKRERQEIARYVSPQMREALEAQWLQKEMEGAKMRMEAGIGTAEDQRMIQMYWTKRAQKARRQPVLSERITPPASWIGFSPAVQMRDVKLKTVMEQGHCVVENQLLFSDKFGTLIKASAVKKGDKLLSLDGKEHLVYEIFERNVDEEIFEIVCSGNRVLPLRITGNHKLPIIRKSKNFSLKEISVKDIRTTDKLLFPKIKFKENVTEIDLLEFMKERIEEKTENFFRIKHCSALTKRKIKVDNDFGYFLGWYLAEGSVSKKGKFNAKNIVSFALSIKEMNIAKWIKSYVENTFNINVNIYEIKKKNEICVRINSEAIGNLLSNLCGCGSKNKQINPLCFSFPKETLLYMAKGWAEGDGWNIKNSGTGSTQYFVTTSEVLAVQMWFVLNSLSFRTRMVKAIARNIFKTGKDCPYFRLAIGVKYFRECFEQGVLPIPNGHLNTSKCPTELSENFFWFGASKIKRISYKGKVIDFSIPGPKHYVTTAGIVHNSIHDYSFWPSDVAEAERRPYVQPISRAFQEEGYSPRVAQVVDHYRGQLQQHGAQGYDSYTASADGSVNITINSTGHERIRRYLRDPTISTFGY